MRRPRRYSRASSNQSFSTNRAALKRRPLFFWTRERVHAGLGQENPGGPCESVAGEACTLLELAKNLGNNLRGLPHRESPRFGIQFIFNIRPIKNGQAQGIAGLATFLDPLIQNMQSCEQSLKVFSSRLIQRVSSGSKVFHTPKA